MSLVDLRGAGLAQGSDVEHRFINGNAQHFVHLVVEEAADAA